MLMLGLLLSMLYIVRLANGKVCIFDIDMTLTRGALVRKPEDCPSLQGHDLPKRVCGALPGVYGMESIQRCLDMGWQVAICTAEPCEIVKGKERKCFLQGLNHEYFTDDVFETPLIQCGHSNKTEPLLAILEFLKVEAKCAVFFDDKPVNGQAATDLGITYQIASDDARDGFTPIVNKDCGLNVTQFEHGMKIGSKRCGAIEVK